MRRERSRAREFGSNKPSLVVVVESPASESNMRAMFKDIDSRLAKHPEVGEYDQKI